MALLILFIKAFFGAFLFFTCSKYKSIEYEELENSQIPETEIPPSYDTVPPSTIAINSTEETNMENNLEEPPKYND